MRPSVSDHEDDVVNDNLNGKASIDDDDDDAMPVISIEDVLNASPFIEVITREDNNDEDEDV